MLPGEIPPRWEALAPEPGLPRIRTSEPDEYAHGVLAERHPALIEQVRGAHPYGPGQHAALDALATEITVGRVAPLPPGAPDATAWDAWMAPYLAGSWFDLPFLVAEAFFYRRLLEAVGYTRPGPWQGVDPFAPAKAAELAGLAAADTTHASGAAGVPPSRADLLLAAVWGNQADLGFLLDHGGRARAGRDRVGSPRRRVRPAVAGARAGTARPRPLRRRQRRPGDHRRPAARRPADRRRPRGHAARQAHAHLRLRRHRAGRRGRPRRARRPGRRRPRERRPAARGRPGRGPRHPHALVLDRAVLVPPPPARPRRRGPRRVVRAAQGRPQLPASARRPVVAADGGHRGPRPPTCPRRWGCCGRSSRTSWPACPPTSSPASIATSPAGGPAAVTR